MVPYWAHSVFAGWRARRSTASSCSCDTWQHSRTKRCSLNRTCTEDHSRWSSRRWPTVPWPKVWDCNCKGLKSLRALHTEEVEMCILARSPALLTHDTLQGGPV